MMKISFIIPIYNAETTLKRCLDSIEGAAMMLPRDIIVEAVCVNDGSIDHSLELLNERKKNGHGYVKYVIIDQPNQGRVIARHTAVLASTGDFCYYLDSDDWIRPNALIDLCNVIDNETDMVFGGQSLAKTEGEEYRCIFDCAETSGLGFVNNVLKNGGTFVGGRMVRTSMCRAIKIDRTYQLNEDNLMNVKWGLMARKVKYVDRPNYCYWWSRPRGPKTNFILARCLSIVNVNVDISLLLQQEAPLIYGDGYIDYFLRNVTAAFSRDYIDAYGFFRDEFRHVFLCHPLTLLAKVGGKGWLQVPILAVPMSMRLAARIYRAMLRLRKSPLGL